MKQAQPKSGRRLWVMKPITRVKDSRKAYSRLREKDRMRKEDYYG